jgi:hypothetical protein
LTTPVIRTHDRASVVRFLRYLVEAFERGDVTSYSSMFEVTGIGRHSVVTSDAADAMAQFDFSDVDEDATPQTEPIRPKP